MPDQPPRQTEPSRGMGWEPGTMRKAMLVGLVLAGGIAALALYYAEQVTKGPLHHYAKLGIGGGEAALRRDLAADHPTGAAVTPLVQRLQALGMQCSAPTGASGTWECSAKLQSTGRSQIHAAVAIGAVNERIIALNVRFIGVAN